MKMSLCKKLCILVFLLLIGGSHAAFSQTLIKGTVSDENLEPLPGAAVQLKTDRTVGVMTDVDGNFSITIPGKSAVLIVSSMGFQTLEFKVDDTRTFYKINLKSDSEMLEEVMVVGYQEVKKSDLTGAVAKANLADMFNTPTVSFDQNLGGRVAGVVVTSDEGMPGGNMNIVIRGNNSLTQDNSPLYVIDGFPVEDPSIANTVNPSDIASMDILKDASATAIYGARGANGVVIITTKKGKAGKLRIAYDGSVSLHNVSRTIDMMDAYEFVKLQMEVAPSTIASERGGYLMTWGENPDGTPKTWTLDDYKNIPQYDWQNEIFRPAWQHSHSLRLSGGTDAIRYNASMSYYDQDGVVLNSNYNKFQARINTIIKRNRLTINLTSDFNRAVSTGASPSQNSYSGMNNLFYNVWGYRPVNYPNRPLSQLMDSGLDEDAVDPSRDYRFNPVMSLKNEYNKRVQTTVRLNAYAEYEIIKGLKLKVSGGYTNYSPDSETFNNSSTRYGGVTSQEKVNASVYRTKSITWLNENTLSYQKTIKRYHSISALAGITFQENDFSSYSARTNMIPNESLGMAGMGDGTPKTITSAASSWSMLSYLARFNYSYKSRYYLTASFRADGSSKFSRKNRFGYFPSAAISWNLAEEDFMKMQQVMNTAKIRLSWGLTGNNRIGEYDRYSTMSNVKSGEGSGVYPWYGDYSEAGMVPVRIGNNELKWETTEQWDLGFDMAFFDSRINLTVDLYHKTTRDLLLDAVIPYSSGFRTARKNIGKVRNRGLEISLSTTNIVTSNFMWTTDFNIAFNRNKVLELAENQTTLLTVGAFDQNYNSSPNFFTGVGYPMGLMYGYVYEGTYKYDDFDKSGDSYTLKAGVPYFTTESLTQPGMPKYKDLNHDGIIDSSDRTIIGRGAPSHTGGFNNNFAFYGVDLSIFFQWSYGNDIMNANKLMFESGNNKARDLNQFASYSKRWTPDNPNSNIPAATASESNKVISSRIIEDGSFLRLKAVTLGYTFPTRMISKIKLSKLRLFISANNLWTWTGYSGYDPEVSIRNTALTPGLDFSAYPRTRMYSFGVNVEF